MRLLNRKLLDRACYYLFDGFAFRPKVIDIEPTYRCNLRCDMCMLYGQSGIMKNAKTREELSLQEIKKLIDEACAYRFFKPSFVLAGGEPFARKDTIQIMEHLRLRNLAYHVVTNGSLLNENTVREIVRVSPTHMTFSVDGPAEIHDSIRGVRGTYDKAVRSIRLIRELDKKHEICIEIQCTISHTNIPYLDKMIELAKELGVNLRYQHLMFLDEKRIKEQNEFSQKYFNIERDMFFNGLLIDLKDFDVHNLVEKVKTIKRLAKKLNVNTSFNPNLDLDEIPKYYQDLDNYKHSNRCFYPWGFVRINPFGDVCPCAEYYVGNVKDADLKSLYNNDKMKRFRKVLKKNRLFPGCIRCCFL